MAQLDDEGRRESEVARAMSREHMAAFHRAHTERGVQGAGHTFALTRRRDAQAASVYACEPGIRAAAARGQVVVHAHGVRHLTAVTDTLTL
jgi:hypothetical protein